jgi:hypothetical protein
MKVTVISDKKGRILSVFGPPETGGKGKFAYVPNRGEKVHVVDVPAGFEERTRTDLQTAFRVKTKGDTVSLVAMPTRSKTKKAKKTSRARS